VKDLSKLNSTDMGKIESFSQQMRAFVG